MPLGANAYPEALRPITDEHLEALITRFEPIAPAEDDCGARDWSVLEGSCAIPDGDL